MDTLSPPSGERPITSRDELTRLFSQSEKPAAQHRIGAEAEKFAIDARSLEPIPYEGPRSILAVLSALQQRYGWAPISEREGGPVVALGRGQSAVTLEPGAQLELSGAPQWDVHGVAAELDEHLAELRSISGELDLAWLSVGFHPMARERDLPWVPKERYGIMKDYLPQRGSRGRDMMLRTATVQANFDYESAADAMRKLRTMLRLSPVFGALSANAPFYEGRVSGRRSERADVWLNMDPKRSGLVERVWADGPLGYEDYVEWALDAGMFFFKRNGKIVRNTGQSFRSFLREGYEGHFPTASDWKWHLGTLFPEVRLKSTLEIRSCDALPPALSLSVVALLTGLLCDGEALGQAEALADTISLEAASETRLQVPYRALHSELSGRPLGAIAEQLFEIAERGLAARARLDAQGRDERHFLGPLQQLLTGRRCPADLLLEGLTRGDAVPRCALCLAEVATSVLSEKK